MQRHAQSQALPSPYRQSFRRGQCSLACTSRRCRSTRAWTTSSAAGGACAAGPSCGNACKVRGASLKTRTGQRQPVACTSEVCRSGARAMRWSLGRAMGVWQRLACADRPHEEGAAGPPCSRAALASLPVSSRGLSAARPWPYGLESPEDEGDEPCRPRQPPRPRLPSRVAWPPTTAAGAQSAPEVAVVLQGDSDRAPARRSDVQSAVLGLVVRACFGKVTAGREQRALTRDENADWGPTSFAAATSAHES